MLVDRCEGDSHWEASAYLFVTLIEQRVLEFHSFDFVDPTVDTDPEVHGHEEPADGALCIALYKIKNLSTADYERVKGRTRSGEEQDAIRFDTDV